MSDASPVPSPPSSADALQALRARLDAIDEGILCRLAERRAVVEEVLARKDETGKALRDPERERAMRAALIEKGRARGLDRTLVEALLDHVLEDSVRHQAGLLARRRNPDAFSLPLTVAYSGTTGSYAELAARRHFAALAPEATFAGLGSFREVVQAVERGGARYGVLPIENTTAGSVHETYDLLAATACVIVGEVVAPVDHCLAGPGPIPLADLRRILSHPMALAQCADLLAGLPGAAPEPFYNTALAARKVKEDGDLRQAAIVSEEAARAHGLVILRAHVADRADNLTRFVVIGREALETDPRVPCKTSLLIATRHEEGALAKALAVLAARRRNLTKIESRPRPERPWEYLFYLDFEGGAHDPEVRRALEELAAATSYLRVLGSYAAGAVPA